MPELPEVETVRRTLYDKLVDRKIERVEIRTPRQIHYPDADTFRAEIEGATFTDIERRGKYLLFRLGLLTLVGHLRMSGHLFVCEAARPMDKHLHVIFHLDNGTQLRYEDQRKFGGFHLLGPDGEGMPPGLKSLGPEPLGADFHVDHLTRVLQGRKMPIKAALLNQSFVAGLGNIYVDEALFCARVHPERLAGTIQPEEVERLYHCICSVLQIAIEQRGTTFSLYFDGEGQEGDMYDQLQVFDRTGEPCRVCSTPIMKLAVAGRGTHVCPECQEAPSGARLLVRRARAGRRGDSVMVAAEPSKRYPTTKRKGDR
jgi:formamidopyrimidine-DNA glycosylase